MVEEKQKEGGIIDFMFKAGAHFGFGKSRRHPSAKPFIFGIKNKVEIFDLEKTSVQLEKAKEFAKQLGKEGKMVLFVAGKNEAQNAVKDEADSINMPYVAGRWIGGTITNFAAIRSRVDKMLDLNNQKEKGELAKYTKKERLMIDREIERLEHFFLGIVPMTKKPDALFVIDPKREYTSVDEARKSNIPVVALLSSDGDAGKVDYPIFGNDSAVASIKFFTEEFKKAYQEGKNSRV